MPDKAELRLSDGFNLVKDSVVWCLVPGGERWGSVGVGGMGVLCSACSLFPDYYFRNVHFHLH